MDMDLQVIDLQTVQTTLDDCLHRCGDNVNCKAIVFKNDTCYLKPVNESLHANVSLIGAITISFICKGTYSRGQQPESTD